MAREFQDRFGPLPPPVKNLVYIVRIKILAMKAGVSSVSTQGRQIVIKPETDDSPLKVGGARRVMSKYPTAVRIGATQIKLDTKVLGTRWKEVLEELLNSSSA